jgi:microcystin-dependent protein
VSPYVASPAGEMVQSATTGITLNNNGSGTAHNNLQPYIVLNYIIKT